MGAFAPASTCRADPLVGPSELDLLLDLDATEFEMAPGVIVHFSAFRVAITPERPHGVVYSLVLRPKLGGDPWGPV
jgi:hypothetical protein